MGCCPVCSSAASRSVVALPFVSPAVAQGYGVTLSSLAVRMTAVEAKATALDAGLAVVETKTASMTAITDPNTSQPTVRFTGVKGQGPLTACRTIRMVSTRGLLTASGT